MTLDEGIVAKRMDGTTGPQWTCPRHPTVSKTMGESGWETPMNWWRTR